MLADFCVCVCVCVFSVYALLYRTTKSLTSDCLDKRVSSESNNKQQSEIRNC
jgi:hypothetical protein